jgi:hypothetical protein
VAGGQGGTPAGWGASHGHGRRSSGKRSSPDPALYVLRAPCRVPTGSSRSSSGVPRRAGSGVAATRRDADRGSRDQRGFLNGRCSAGSYRQPASALAAAALGRSAGTSSAAGPDRSTCLAPSWSARVAGLGETRGATALTLRRSALPGSGVPFLEALQAPSLGSHAAGPQGGPAWRGAETTRGIAPAQYLFVDSVCNTDCAAAIHQSTFLA